MSHKEWREWVSTNIHYAEQCPGLPISPDKAAAAQEQKNHIFLICNFISLFAVYPNRTFYT